MFSWLVAQNNNIYANELFVKKMMRYGVLQRPAALLGFGTKLRFVFG
jgi:hypothetical protein